MIGLSGYVNFNTKINVKNFNDSSFISKLQLKSKKYKKKNINITFLDNNFDESVNIQDDSVCIVVGNIYEDSFFKSKKSKSRFIYSFYKKGKIKEIPKIDGSFAFIIVDRNQNILLGSDQNSFIPIFYTYKDQQLIFSFDLWHVSNNQLNTKELNYFNFSSIILTGGIGLNDDTKIKDIYKLSSGNMLLIKRERPSIILCKPFFYKPKRKTMNAHLCDVTEDLMDSISKRTKNKKNIGFGLSGGLDSRILISALNKFPDINIFSFNYGRKQFVEKKIADEVANLFNIVHNNFVLPYDTHLKYICDSIYYSSGESSITLSPQMHIHNTFKKINNINTLMFGSFFDYTGGDSGISEKILSFKKLNQLFAYYQNGYVLKYNKNDFLKIFNSKKEGLEHYEKIISDIRENLNKIEGENFADINTSFYFQHRGKNWYNRHLSLPLLSNNLSIPFYDNKFLKSISQVPTSMRKNDTFRVKLLNFLNPDAANIMYDATLAPAKIEYPLNKKLKLSVQNNDKLRYQQWIKSKMSKKFRSFKNDANFIEWISTSKKYQNFIINTLLDKDKSVLINSVYSEKKIRSIIYKQISGKQNNLRMILMLINLEISGRIAEGYFGPNNDKFISFNEFL